MLSPSTRVLHMNSQAVALSALLGGDEPREPITTAESLPAFVGAFCQEVLEHLERCGESEDWTQFELHRVFPCSTPPMLLRGFGVPGPTERSPRVVVMLQPVAWPAAPDS